MTDSTKPAIRSDRVRQWADTVAAAMVVAVTFMAYMPTGWTGDSYTSSRGQMQDALVHKLSFQRHFLGFSDMTLSNPQVSFNPAHNRIAIQADTVMESGLFHQPLTEPLVAFSGLHYGPPTHSIRLSQPSVDRFDLQNVPGGIGSQISSIGSLIAGQLLNDYAIYTFKPDQLKVAGITIEPGTVTVLPEGVHVQTKRP